MQIPLDPEVIDQIYQNAYYIYKHHQPNLKHEKHDEQVYMRTEQHRIDDLC